VSQEEGKNVHRLADKRGIHFPPYERTVFAIKQLSASSTSCAHSTGQREEAALGLYFYNARWYDPALGHFLSPDTLVPDPGNALDYHRYAYVRFNPLKYTDPSGHCPICISIAVGTVIDVATDFFIAQATGTEFDVVESLMVNGATNLVTAGFGGKLAKLRHVGKVAGLVDNVAGHGDEAARLLGRVTTRAVGEGAQRFVLEAAQRAEERVLREGLEGSLDVARSAAARGEEILPGLFKYDPSKSIAAYQQHHLWPLALGGPKEGWVVYTRAPHTAAGGIQDRLNQFLRGRLNMAQRELEAWARQHPDEILPWLREFYRQEGIPFPY
jgi:RHS repeat-associated protein